MPGTRRLDQAGLHSARPNTLWHAVDCWVARGQGLTQPALSKPWRPPLHLVAALLLAISGVGLVGQATYMTLKAMLAQVLLERAFQTGLATGARQKPWHWADTWPVARIAVPRLRASAIVLAGSSGQALAFGPGHVEGTPEAGEPGTAVYAAHRDTHFAFLKDVVAGDLIEVTRADRSIHRFRVTHTAVVPWDASAIDPLAAGQHLVLATCWPFADRTPGPLRYLVHAHLVAD